MNKQDRIYNELVHEPAGLWFVSDSYGSKVMVKTPSTTIKAIIKGCRIEFPFGKDEINGIDIFHTGLKILDDPVHYQLIFSTHRFLDEHFSIAKVLNLVRVQIQLVNELNVCCAFGDLVIPETKRQDILSLLQNPKRLYVGDFNGQVKGSLDRFEQIFMNPSSLMSASIPILQIEGRIENFQTMKNSLVDVEGNSINTSIAGNEGDELEKEVFLVLQTIFGRNTFRNPKISSKNKTRERTDILAYSQHGVFLIETKALGVLQGEIDQRKMERKVIGLQKQICKAVCQLVGATKKISERVPIYDVTGKEVEIDRQIVPHCIILISEFLPFGNWDQVTHEIMKGMIEIPSFIHLMGLKEFMTFIGHARGDCNQFDHFLLQRADHFANNPDVFRKTIFQSRNNIANNFLT